MIKWRQPERGNTLQELDTREDLLNAVREMRTALDREIAAAGDRIEEPGAFEAWSFKDLIAHLTGWRIVTAARLEAGLNGTEPEFPWPNHLQEGEEDLHEINRWFYETNRDKPLAQVLDESSATFDRVERAVQALPENDLFTPDHFAWLHWSDESLGPAVVRGSLNHYYIEHEPDIREWLSNG